MSVCVRGTNQSYCEITKVKSVDAVLTALVGAAEEFTATQ